MTILLEGTIPFSTETREKYRLPSGSIGHYRIAETGEWIPSVSLSLHTTARSAEVHAREDGKLLNSTLYFIDGKIVDRAPATGSTNAIALQEVYAADLKIVLKGHVGASREDANKAYEAISGFFEGEPGVQRVQLGGKLRRSDL